MLNKLLWDASQANPQKTAIVYGSVRIDYQTLYQLVANLSTKLSAQGVGAGDCVGVVLPNCPEFVISLFACARLSAIMQPLDPAFQASELKRFFDDGQPKVIVTDTWRAAACREAIQDSATILQVDVDDLEPIEFRVEDGEEINGEVEHMYLYTSGSTGQHKRICRTQKNLFCEGQNFVKTLALTADDNILGIVPFSHSYGLENALFTAMYANSTLVILEPIMENGVPVEAPFVARQERVLELIQQEKIRVLPAIPYQYAALAQLPLDVEADLSGVSWFISSASFLSEETYQQFIERFGQPIRSSYGSTEAGSICIDRAPAEQMEYGTLGAPCENVTIKIVDDNNQELSANQTGHVLVKTPVLPEVIYSQLPELSQQVVWNGYYRTSDLGYIDDQGRVCLTGRKKVFIDTAGHKVDPQEIEQVLLAHSKVKEAVVLGVKVDHIGQVIKAVIVSKETLQESEILAYCREQLARFKVPRIIEFREQLPRSPLGKILKKELLNVPTYMAQEELLPEAKHIGQVVPSLQDDTQLIAPSASINHWQSLKKRLYQELNGKSLDEQKGILTGYIQQIIVETLQSDVTVFSPEQSFKNMGFDSLFGAEFQNRLSNLIGISLPMMTIWNYPTINEFAVAVLNKMGDRTVSSEFLNTSLEKEDRELSEELSATETEKHHSAPSTSVVPLQPRGNFAPFYCLSGAGGGVLYLDELAQAMGDQHPVYGLETAGFYGEMPPFKTVPEAATYQIAQLQQHLAEQVKSRNRHADKPFYLGGYSFGGLVAYEMAQQVVKAGGHVGGLFLLDTFPPSEKAIQKDEVYFILTYESFFLEKLGLEPTLTKEQLSPLTSEERLLLFKQSLEAAGSLPFGSSLAQIRGIINTASADFQATDYLPTDFVSLPIHFFVAMDDENAAQGFVDGWSEYSKEEAIQARIDGWSKYGEVTVHEVPGTHRNMVLAPHVEVLAEKIKACMKDKTME